ncbi:MAG: hypothetical protein OXT74_07280 [Candidatus Poribacteria bacterium]|nr:hypothetical protein [Candidatus Poribacteria bacterium]
MIYAVLVLGALIVLPVFGMLGAVLTAPGAIIFLIVIVTLFYDPAGVPWLLLLFFFPMACKSACTTAWKTLRHSISAAAAAPEDDRDSDSRP